jgi:hypothetical protein
MSINVKGFEKLKEDYESCLDLGEICSNLRNASHLHSSRWLSVQGQQVTYSTDFSDRFPSIEIHLEGLAGHFCQDKTIEEVEHQFY